MRHGACKAQGDRRTSSGFGVGFGGQIATPNFPHQIYGPPIPPPPGTVPQKIFRQAQFQEGVASGLDTRVTGALCCCDPAANPLSGGANWAPRGWLGTHTSGLFILSLCLGPLPLPQGHA